MYVILAGKQNGGKSGKSEKSEKSGKKQLSGRKEFSLENVTVAYLSDFSDFPDFSDFFTKNPYIYNYHFGVYCSQVNYNSCIMKKKDEIKYLDKEWKLLNHHLEAFLETGDQEQLHKF